MAFPDVCKTPAPDGVAPIPYPNEAMLEDAIPGTTADTVILAGFLAATITTEIAMSQGDDAGVEGGVISSTVIGPCQFKEGSESVLWMGEPAIYQGCLLGQNDSANSNIPTGLQVSPSQETVTIGP